MKKIIVVLVLLVHFTVGKSFGQLSDIDEWWVTFGIGNAYEGFSNSLRGTNMFGNINVHSGNYYYQLGVDDSGVPAFSDRTMGAVHFDVGKVIMSDYYQLVGFGGLGIMNYAYSDTNAKIHNLTTIGINLNAQFIVKPFKTFGFGIEPFVNLRYRHTVSGLNITLFLGDVI